MRNMRTRVEQQIARARASGALSGLEGEGRPLPDRPVETEEAAALSAGLRIMAQAGVVPEEFELLKRRDVARSEYTRLTDGSERRAAMQRIADLELRYEIAREARRKFMT